MESFRVEIFGFVLVILGRILGCMIDQIHKQVAYRPFRPFLVETSGGTLIRVARPEWIYFPPETGHFMIFEGNAASYIDFRDVRSILIEQRPIPLNEIREKLG